MESENPTELERDIHDIRNELRVIRENLRALTFVFQELLSRIKKPEDT